MPSFCRLNSASNLLSYLDYKVLGMNTVQLDMKVPGCRTQGHLENNLFASVNLNIGPGECEWFGVPWEFYPIIDKMCRECVRKRRCCVESYHFKDTELAVMMC